MKKSTIQHAFEEARIWPVSCKQALRKIKQYSKPEPLPLTNDDEPTLPTIPRPPRNILKAKRFLYE